MLHSATIQQTLPTLHPRAKGLGNMNAFIPSAMRTSFTSAVQRTYVIYLLQLNIDNIRGQEIGQSTSWHLGRLLTPIQGYQTQPHAEIALSTTRLFLSRTLPALLFHPRPSPSLVHSA